MKLPPHLSAQLPSSPAGTRPSSQPATPAATTPTATKPTAQRPPPIHLDELDLSAALAHAARIPLQTPPPLSIDARTTPVPLPLLRSILSSTAAQALLGVFEGAAPPGDVKKLHQGALPLQAFYLGVARGLGLGATSRKGLDAPMTYNALRTALLSRGLSGEWRALMDALPSGVRDRLLAGKATAHEVFVAWAKDRGSWRARIEPVALEHVVHELRLEGRLGELERARTVMTPGQRARLEAGVMTPQQIQDVLQDAKTRQVDVVIVGAGMAGLTAAQELQKQGLSVVVLEASPHIGGRTRDKEAGGARFDEGAAWIHATDENPLTPIAKQLGLTLVENNAPFQAFGGPESPEQEGEHLTAALDDVHGALHAAAQAGIDVPASQVAAEAPSSTPGAVRWRKHAENTIGPLTMGTELSQTSAVDAGGQPAEGHGAASEQTPDLFIEEGMAALTQSFSHGVPVRLSTPVEKVSYGSGGAVVEAGGVTFQAKKVVMTASTAVLQSGRIAFDPPLGADKQAALAAVPMATFDKIAIRFDKDVFSHKGTKAGAFVYELDDQDAMDVVVRPMNKDVVIALVGGDFADRLRAQGEAHAVERLLSKLERIYGPGVRDHVVGSAITNWRDDPWHGGSFTSAQPGYAHMRAKLSTPLKDETGAGVVFFAGEAHNVRWGGMVPAAHLSAKQAAADVVSSLAERAGLANAKSKLTLADATAT